MILINITCILVIISIVFWAMFHTMSTEKRKSSNLFFLSIFIVSFVLILILSPFMDIEQLQYIMIFTIVVALISLVGYLFSRTKTT